MNRRPDSVRRAAGWRARARRLRPAVVTAAMLLASGCSLLGGSREPSTIYAPDPRAEATAAWPSVDWQLSLSRATASRMTDSLRIMVRPQSNELQVYKGASWAKVPSDMVEDAVLRALEDSDRIPAVARQGSGIAADYKLVLDVRRFESDYTAGGATPAATIEVNAKLLHAPDQEVVAARTFLQAPRAASTDVADVVAAFESGLGTLAGELAGWVLSSGDAHGREHR
jgi:cholesterol transport system auxiliary component